jgi:hypothetical protein
MTYNSWKLMDKIDVAVKTVPNYHGFTGFIVEHGDEKALEAAKEWSKSESGWNREKHKYDNVYEGRVYTFDNEGFTAKILNSAGGSSQGGRLSFWMCEVEKDGAKFTIGVNDAILADLIKNSVIRNGLITEKVMFARKGGQPGLIHENMDAYTEAVADMKQKADLKSAKKTSKWVIGGVYSTLTQTDVCLGEVYDTIEEYTDNIPGYDRYHWYARTQTKLRKANKPQKMIAWMHWYNFSKDKNLPETFGELLQQELDSGHIIFSAGRPPARAKASQYEVKDSDYVLIDKLLEKREEYVSYSESKITGRYVKELKVSKNV